MPHAMWRRVAVVVALSLVSAACTSDSNEAFPAPDAFKAPSIEEVESSMREAGVNVVDSVEEPVADPWLTITANQMASMAAEVSSRGGLSGLQLDEVMPPPVEGVPSFAYWIAAWLHDEPTVRAAIAAKWYPEDTDWARAPDLLYARATLLLFMADVAEDFDQNLPPLDPGEMFRVAGPIPEASQLLVSATDVPLAVDVGAACLVITNFFTKGIADLFDKLRIQADWLGKGPFSFVGGLLATLWNTVVSLAQAAVEGLVRNLTEPVMRWVGKAIAIAGIVSHISSYVDGWNIELAKDPESVHWGPPAAGGLFRVQPASNHRPWDAALRTCARTLNVALPDLLSPGSRVEWTLDKPGLIIEEGRDQVVPPGGRMPEFRYRVPNETTNPPHSGDLKSDDFLVSVRAPRSDLSNVLKVARNLISGLVGDLVPAIRIVNLRSAVEEGINALIDPVLAQAERAIAGAIPFSVLEVTAVQMLVVAWHETSPTTTTTPRPSTLPQPQPTQPPPPPRPPFGGRQAPPCEGGCGSSFGDPHLRTVDGHGYEFQAAGEFVLLRSDDRSVEVQVRFEPFSASTTTVSVTTAVATRLGDHRVGYYYGDSGEVEVLINGESLLPGEAADFGPDGTVEAFPRGMWVEYPDGTQLYVLGQHVLVDPSDDLRARGIGLIGPVTPGGLSIPPLPDGSILPDPGLDRELHYRLLYGQFRNAWLVPVGESLFRYGPGEGQGTYDIAGFPSPNLSYLRMDDLPSASRARGLEACAAISDESLVEMCVFDVGLTGDNSWVGGYARLGALMTEGPSILIEDEAPSRPVESRAGVPTLQLRGDLSAPNAGTHTGHLVAAEGTVLIARTRICSAGANVDLVLAPDSGDPSAVTRVPLCQESPALVRFDADDEYLPTESYVFLATGGVYEVALNLTGDLSAASDVDIFVDPDPVIVRAAGDDLSVFSGTYRLEHIADTVVYVFSHSGGNVAFSSPTGVGAGGACGNLEYGLSSPGEPGGRPIWRLNFCAHTEAVNVGRLSGNLKVPMIVFNRTGNPVEVTLGLPD